MNNAEQAHVWWEGQVMAWDEEEELYDEGNDMVQYQTDLVECPCGYECPRYAMEEHWCDDLEEMLHAIHTPKR